MVEGLSDPADRGRAIFERLRTRSPEPEPAEEQAAGEASEVVTVTESVAAPDLEPAPASEELPPLHLPELENIDVPEPPEPVATVPNGPSPFARSLPRVLAVANQKGGVGKTTTAVNLGACLAELGYRVLVCDLDPQGNASTGLGLNPRNMQTSMYDVILNDVPLEDCVEPS